MSAKRGRSIAPGAGPTPKDAGTFHLFVLGVPIVRWGERVVAFRTRKELALLVYLALTGTPQSREQLAALLWPDHDAAAARSLLRTTLSRLRQHLAEAAGITPDDLTLLRTEHDQLGREVITIARDAAPSLGVDVQLLEAAISRAGAPKEIGQAPTAMDGEALLQAAIDVYRGPFLEGVQLDDAPEFDEWVAGQRAYWESQVQLLLGRLADLQLERGAFTGALTTGRRWLGLNPLSEVAYRVAIRAMAGMGDRSGAIALYEQCRTVLQAELHMNPSAETVALAERLRRLTASTAPSALAGRAAGKVPAAPAAPAEPAHYEIGLPFVGREREFAAMVSAYQAAQTGEVRVIVLEGEAGIGKTRLAEEFLAWATLEGGDVLRGQGRGYAAGATGATLPYQPLVDALRPRLERENAPEDLLADVWLAELVRLFPELHERYPDLPRPDPRVGVEAAGQARLYEAVLHLILALAERARPGALVTFYDDIQWSDLATRDVLLYLLKRSHEAASSRLIVLAVRTEAMAGESSLANWIGMVSRQVPTLHLVLGPLDLSETEQALDVVLSHPGRAQGTGGDLHSKLEQQFASWLYTQSEGQPFYLVETLRALVDRGILIPEVSPITSGGRPEHVSQPQRLMLAPGVDRFPHLLVGSVRDLIRGRLAGLSAPALEMLTAAAVLGPEATFERLCQVAELQEGVGLGALDELLERRLLVEAAGDAVATPRLRAGADEAAGAPPGAKTAGFRFGQNPMLEVVYTEAGDTRRRILHRRALAILEREGVSPAEQARHALALGLTEQALRSSVEAGEAALAVFAERDAQAHYAAVQSLLTGPAGSVAETEPGAEQPQPPRWHDWGEAPHVSLLHGRSEELATVRSWVSEQGCRVVELAGVGGIGKTSLVARLAQDIASEFPVVYWRSLRNAPPPEVWLIGAIAAVSMGQAVPPEGFDERLRLLLGLLRAQRSLLVLDNLETVLEPGAVEVGYLPGYEGYGEILKQLAESVHRGCLLLTSREQPLPARENAVRAIRLEGLEIDEAQALLGHRGLFGNDAAWQALVERYAGNALALQVVGETISVVFGGDIDAFLVQEIPVVGGIRQLLDEQLARLSRVERAVLNWLAIEREPVGFATLAGDIGPEATRGELIEAVQALSRRSLLERGARTEPTGTRSGGGAGGFTLQPVVLEYVTERLVGSLAAEIEAGHTGDIGLLSRYPIVLATAKDYVRQSQERLIGWPILDRLRSAYHVQSAVDERLRSALTRMAALADEEQGYGPTNLVALLRLLRGDLRGLDLSMLVLRNAYLQGVDMQDTNLAGATIKDSVFTNAFDMIVSVDISENGQYWAAATGRGEVYIWQAGGRILHRVLRDPIVLVWRLALSPDGSVLAGGTSGGEIKLWDVASGVLLWSAGRHTSAVRDVAFSPDGRLIASRGSDATVRVWDRSSGTQRQDLDHPASVATVAWSPDGKLLASGDQEGTIRLWQVRQVDPENAFADSTHSGQVAQAKGARPEQWSCVRTYQDNSRQRIAGLAFSPDAVKLSSMNFDGIVTLWNLLESRLEQTLTEGSQGGTSMGGPMAWSPDGRTLAGVHRDHTIWLWNWENWDFEQGGRMIYRAALRGHTQLVAGVAFTPDSQSLLSGSSDGSLRVWDVASGQCTRMVEGYTAALSAVDWSPDGTRLVTSGRDSRVSVYDASGKAAPQVLHESNRTLVGAAWSPDGRIIASAEFENTIRLWDAVSGQMLQDLRHPDDPFNRFYGLAWSPDGKWLAAGTFSYGVLVWDVAAVLARQPGLRSDWPKLPGSVRASNRIEWSPDAAYVATGVDEGTVYVWDAASGGLLHRLKGHLGSVSCVAWSLDSHKLASAGTGPEGGELFVWDMQKNGERVCTINTNRDSHIMICWGSLEGAGCMGREEALITGGSDGALRWWNLATGECEKMRMSHGGRVGFFKRSLDGTRLASCGDDGAITIWDLQTGEHLQTLRRDRPYERLDISGVKGLTEAQKATLRALGAVDRSI